MNRLQKFLNVIIISFLLLLGIMHLWYSVFYRHSCYDLINFSFLSYVSKWVLFTAPYAFIINKGIANVIPVAVVPMNYPPGVYVITKIVSFIKDSQLAMHVFLFFIQLINIFFTYILLRKVSNKIISFSITLFLLVYTNSVVVVVDSFVQPLLILALLALIMSSREKNRLFILMSGFLAGLIWFFRQNVGLFFSCMAVTWLIISSLSVNNKDTKPKRRSLLWGVVTAYILCGLFAITILNYTDDKVWYMLCYLIFWLVFLCYLYKKKELFLNISQLAKNLSLFLLPLFLILGTWLYVFGKTIGFYKYFYMQYLSPFNSIKAFEHPISFHLNIAWNGFCSQLTSQSGLRASYYAVLNILNWGALFLVPFLFNCFFVGYFISQIFRKKNIDKQDLRMIALPVVGIMTFYPIESLWILTSKLIIFLLSFAYFFHKLYSTRKIILYIICSIFIIFSAPRILTIFIQHLNGTYVKRYASFIPISEKADIRLPPEIVREVKKTTKIIRDTIDHSRFYAIGSFEHLEIFYFLMDYSYPNFYTTLRKDLMNEQAEQDLINRLSGYPYILLSQKDYLEYKSDRNSYLDNPGSIGDLVMNYVINNYRIEISYNKPNDVNDAWLPNFLILKRIN